MNGVISMDQWKPEDFLSIGKDCTIWPGAKIIGVENIIIGNAVIIDSFAFLHIKKYLILDDFVHIAAYSSITGGERCDVAPFTSLSWGVRVFTSTENLAGLFGPKMPSDLRKVIQAPVQIGRHVLIGANSVILPGAIIGDGAIIGAGSVVPSKHFIRPWSIWGGVPVHYIKDRQKIPVLEAEQQLGERYYNRLGEYIGQV